MMIDLGVTVTDNPTVTAAALRQAEMVLETQFALRDVRDAVNALTALLESDDTLDFLSYAQRDGVLQVRDDLLIAKNVLAEELRTTAGRA